jgi:hypothetical protein
LPPCLSYSTNNSNGSYLGGELGCIEIFGTCNIAGSYDVTIKTLGWATLVVTFSVPYDFEGYHIDVNSSCNISVTASGNDASTTGGSDGDAMAMATGGQGNVTYMWSNGGTTAMISGLIAGTYDVTVMDDILTGCEAVGSVTVSEPPAGCLIAVTASGTNVTSNGGSDGSAEALVTGAQGNLTYMWSNGGTTSMITGLPTNTYSVTVSDDVVAGCSASATITILTVLPCDTTIINLTTSSQDESLAGANDGQATVVATGGTSPYAYLWNNGNPTATAGGLSAGNYAVTVTDNNGCYAIAAVTITVFNPCDTTSLAVSIGFQNETSSGANDGQATAAATGGAAPYSYLWDNGNPTNAAAGLTAGTYTVTASDANGCTAIATTTISVGLITSDKETKMNLTIFPNPNNGEFVLSFDQNTGEKKTNLEVTNSLGQIIYSQALLLKQGNQQFTISLNEISTGIYYVTVGSKTKPLLIK